MAKSHVTDLGTVLPYSRVIEYGKKMQDLQEGLGFGQVFLT
jgi:hypothetical protein